MLRRFFSLTASILFLGIVCPGCAKADSLPEYIDPAEAKAKDPDFVIQGEYVGEGTWLDGSKAKIGAQVIADGKGQFTVVLTKGGLPGNGWNRGDAKVTLTGKREAGATALIGKELAGRIAGDVLSIANSDAKVTMELKRTVRHSPTEGAKPPKDAVVLFDGTTADNFKGGKLTEDKNLMCDATTKQGFGDCTLHLEFRLSYMPNANGQGRSNSGVYLHDCYECQVLDSFGLEGKDNECGGFYSVREPGVNMCYPPLTWQTYDFDFTAPKYKDGKKVANAKITVKHNGVVIHPDIELKSGTPGRQGEGPAPRPFYLQGHGDKVEYRNIWVAEKKQPS